jgi:hypothetical protein
MALAVDRINAAALPSHSLAIADSSSKKYQAIRTPLWLRP